MNEIIAAVSTPENFLKALSSPVKTIFYLAPDIENLTELSSMAKAHQKKIFIHMDMAEGIGKDKLGVKFVKSCGIDGILSTKNSIIKFAKEAGLLTVQRFFIIDTHSLSTTIDAVKTTRPDMIEIMPGCVPKVISKLKSSVPVPIIAGGLIETPDEAQADFSSGAPAISTGNENLWGGI